jgi:ankyrin repeat protein
MNIIQKKSLILSCQLLTLGLTLGFLENNLLWATPNTNTESAKDNKGNTPLYQAIWGGDEEIVEALINGGADVNFQDNKGNTPLHQAIWGGNEEIVEALINGGADVNIVNNNGDSPLNSAIKTGNREIINLLNQ